MFFPTLKERNIDTIIMLGDTFDRRKYTNHVTVKAAKDLFFSHLERENIFTYMIIGNHDTTYKNTNEVNTVELLLSEYKNITPISDPKTFTIGNTKIALIPWICPANQKDCFDELQQSEATICMGHLEIDGFEMYRGHTSTGGLSPKLFKKFDTVFSGHYHHKSTKGNVTYLGTPYEITWQDFGDKKGFHIFDTETLELEFVPNPYNIFTRIEYNDEDQEPINLDELDLSEQYVKLVVVNKTDYYKFDHFVNKLYTKGCHDINIVEDMSEFSSGEVDENIDLEDTLSILSNYIDSIQTDVDKDKIKTYMKTLYTEAVNLEAL